MLRLSFLGGLSLALAGATVTFGADFAGGVGTAVDPYQIATAEHLDNVRGHLAAHFRMTADVDLGVAPWNTGAGWNPIGSSLATNRFTGVFDGAGYAIQNLSIVRSNTTYQALFGYLDGATVRNLLLGKADVRGGDHTAVLAGHMQNATVENTHAGGHVLGDTYVGGLAGEMVGGSLRGISVACTIQGSQNTGGLAGRCNNGVLRQSHVTGTVQGGSHSGGLVGNCYQVMLADCYSRATVSGTSYVGGALGYSTYGRSHRLYSAGAVSGTASHVGGFVGYAYGSAVADCYWDTQTSGQATSSAGAGRTTAQMLQRATFEHYNFFTLWRIDEGHDYPTLRDLSGYAEPATLSPTNLAGAGTPGSPYIITTADELNVVRQDLSAHYRLGNDIDLSTCVIWDEGAGWEPIGTSVATNRFSGVFDGAGYAIRSLPIERSGTSHQGLFGYLDGATVRDVRLESVSLHGGDYTGPLAGYALNSTVTNTHASGDVSGRSYVGGFVGCTSGGSLLGVSASCTVESALNYAGGLTGDLTGSGAIVSNAYTLGTVRGANYTGGLAGRGYQATLYDSYSRAAVSGASYIGGAFGHHHYGGMYRCYSAGAVSGTANYIGGLTGYRYSATATDCYWDTQTSGQATSAAGTGQTTTQMLQQATYSGWDFVTIWEIEETLAYPRHRGSTASIALTPVVRWHSNDASTGSVFEVVANTAWTSRTDDAWIVIGAGMSGRDNGSVVYSLSANPVPALRTGTITVSNTLGVAQTFTVHQEAVLSISPQDDGHDAAASAGHAIAVAGNVSWTAQANAAWLVVTAGAAGTNDGTVVYSVAENTTLVGRTNTITIAGGGLQRTFTVTQAGAPTYLEIAPDWREHSRAASAGHTLTVTANMDWNAAVDAAWLQITGATNGTGNGTVSYAVQASDTHLSRDGEITVSGGGLSRTLRVRQRGTNTVNVTVATAGDGVATGAGTYFQGQTVWLTAIPGAVGSFSRWTELGITVSGNTNYSFVAESDHAVTAVFLSELPPRGAIFKLR